MHGSYNRPSGLLAGFHASNPHVDVPELLHIGEQWAPREFFIPSHSHHVWEIYVQVSGESQWKSEGTVYTLAPGGMFAVAPGVEHTMHGRPTSKHHFYFAALDLAPIFDRLPQIANDWHNRKIVYTPHAEATLTPFRQTIREVSVDLPYRGAGIRIALDALVLEASRVGRERASSANYVIAHPAVARAKELLDARPEEPWRLVDLARSCGLSPNHLVECFAEQVGVPPRQYQLQVRIRRACEMLTQTELSVTEVGLELGFCSGQHFTVTFKRFTGTTPLKYRHGSLQ